jgi:two-component system OmpR family response regulator
MARTDKKIRIFSALEVANICGVVNQTAINWIKNGYLKAFQTPGGQYRVYSEDLINFLQDRGMRMPDELHKILEDQLAIDTVLIVDDEEDLNNTIKKGLEVLNPEWTIFQAFDGFEAGKLSVANRPNLIILDVELPGVDGVRLCKSLREDAGTPSPLIIGISGKKSNEKPILEAGADAFINKPFEVKALAERIEQLVEERNAPTK